jgi:hypothetical protein
LLQKKLQNHLRNGVGWLLPKAKANC